MKKNWLLTGLALSLFSALLLTGCLQDECQATLTYTVYQPVFAQPAEFRKPIQMEAARALKSPGRIYYYKDYLFINEASEGIHIIDNSNPASPAPVGFLKIGGNGNMAIRNDILYADNYVDLVAVNIADPLHPKYISRTENVFWDFGFYADLGYLVDYVPTKETMEVSCNDSRAGGDFFWFKGGVNVQYDVLAVAESANQGSVADQVGIGGSMARFTITNGYLYALRDWDLKIFDLKNTAKAELAGNIQLGWGMETIFPYEDKLFFGANSGMHIYSISDPVNPQHIATFSHANACDPVFIDGNLAYVTLRDGTDCQTFNNQLDVVDISSLSNPVLLKSWPMQNPHGLSKVGDNLYICEGKYGLKVFDASDWKKIGDRELAHLTGFTTFDIIALSGNKPVAMVIGEDGLYQFDATNPADLKQLSVIQVQR